MRHFFSCYCQVHERALVGIQKALEHLTKEIKEMAANLDRLTADVQAQATVIDSAVTLLGGLHQAILDLIAAGNSDPALAVLADQVEAKTAALANAVATNPVPTPGATGATGATGPAV